jgi:hypothetical protein
MDSALIYDTFEDRLLAAIIGRAVKDYVVARRRRVIDVNGEFDEPALLKVERKIEAKASTLALSNTAMLGCNRTELRTAWQFMYEGGLEFYLDSLAPNQDPGVIRDYAEQAILGFKQITWK